jgi:hypothetical protein
MLGTSRHTLIRGVGLASLLVVGMILVVSLSAVAAPMPHDMAQATPVPTPVPSLLTRYLPIAIRRPALPNPPEPPTVLTPAADAQILQGYPTTNYRIASSMWVGYDDYLTPQGQTARSLVRFDLSAVPSESTIIHAALRLRLNGSYDFMGYTRLVTTYRVTETWTENSVTWNTAPGHGEAYGSAVIGHGQDALHWYSFPVTSLVQAWIDGVYTNHGIMLRGPEHGPNWRSFSTREGGYPPRLEISYASPSGELTTVTLEAAPAAEAGDLPDHSSNPDVPLCHEGPSDLPCVVQE